MIKVLIVEDSKVQAEKLKYVLEKDTYRVIIAKNGKEALALVNKQKPDLVISDIIMPEMDGYELCLKIKSDKKTRDIPVILLTSLSVSDEILQAVACGADSFVTKPYSNDYLLSNIRQILSNKYLNKTKHEKQSTEIILGSKKHFITANHQQMVTLLISTYEAAIRKNEELLLSQDELKSLNDNLEEIVALRTLELSKEIILHKNTEKQLVNTMKHLERSNHDLEQFAYVTSHDLQEPLRMVSSFTQLLEKRYKDKLDQDAHDFIHYAVDGANRMQKMINDLLDYSRITTKGKKFEKIDTLKVLENTISNIQQLITDNSAIITNDELPVLLADESQLLRLFQNLIENAIKFKKKTELPKIHISCEKKNEYYEFAFNDNGIGIDMQFHDRVFTIFQRLHSKEEYSGNGIGLSICKRIIERNGGRIWFKSKEYEGTTFYFTLKT